jgi:hypothetical protein
MLYIEEARKNKRLAIEFDFRKLEYSKNIEVFKWVRRKYYMLRYRTTQQLALGIHDIKDLIFFLWSSLKLDKPIIFRMEYSLNVYS